MPSQSLLPGAALTIDVALIGPANPVSVLIHSCGVHGIEGYAGSAIQLQLLEKMVKEVLLVLDTPTKISAVSECPGEYLFLGCRLQDP